ncbi:hypothetical protein ACJZ2D_001802 [Fusarium nematophilum]
MLNWHESHCRKPHIYSLEVPYCLNCTASAPVESGVDELQDELELPNTPKRSAMRLKWPPSVSYRENAFLEDPDGSLHKALYAQLGGDYDEAESGGQALSRPCSDIAVQTSGQSSSGPQKDIYEPLRDARIRILRLQPGQSGDLLHADFEIIHLRREDPDSEPGPTPEPPLIPSDENQENDKSSTSYEAISYTWANSLGERKKNKAIFIGERWDALKITENCYDALQTCRFQDKPRRLWIDAICINQSDVAERSHQVGMMRYIYSAASRVLIFLSETSAGKDDPDMLIQNPYFSRVWVVQEIASAREAYVLFGRQAMRWGFFHSNLQRLSIKTWIQHFDRARQVDIESFVSLLEDTRACQASDPRDKVFALLGLSPVPLDPDYTLSPPAVYTGLAASLVTHANPTLKPRIQDVAGRVLDLASHGHKMSGLPSWVPDWSFFSTQPCQKRWECQYSLPAEIWKRQPDAAHHKFRVHCQSGSLCILAVQIDTMAQFLRRGFHLPSQDGIVSARAGEVEVALASDVTRRCQPSDQIFRLCNYTFALILRKVAEPHFYRLVGLCKYSVLSSSRTIEIEAIRHLIDWQWLLSGRNAWQWTEFESWEKLQLAWSSLEDLQRSERRTWTQRLILKARFLTKQQNLMDDARYVLRHSTVNSNALSAFCQRRWIRNIAQWKAEDHHLTSLQQQRESQVRGLLPGYRSLEASPEILHTTDLGQPMWLPVSLDWFELSERVDGDHLFCRSFFLGACVTKRVPLPPLHLIDSPRAHLRLSTGVDLETGLRQLQRLSQNHTLKLPVSIPKSRASKPGGSYVHYIRHNYWDVFLQWLARPVSPTLSNLRTWSSKLLIWEASCKSLDQINELHEYLDTVFERHLKPSFSLDHFFESVYREQFYLLWTIVFQRDSIILWEGPRVHTRILWADSVWDSERFSAHHAPAEFARGFFWRFSRSFHKAYRHAEGEMFEVEMERQWVRFLDWLVQRPLNPNEKITLSPEVVPQPRPPPNPHLKRNEVLEMAEEDEIFPTGTGQNPAPWANDVFAAFVHFEIQRRRLAERLFAPLYEDRHAVPQECPDFQLEKEKAISVAPLAEEGRRRKRFWEDVMDYITESERYMSGLKPRILSGLMEDVKMGDDGNGVMIQPKPCAPSFGTHCSILYILNRVAAYADRYQTGGLWNCLNMIEVGLGGMTDEEYKACPCLGASCSFKGKMLPQLKEDGFLHITDINY